MDAGWLLMAVVPMLPVPTVIGQEYQLQGDLDMGVVLLREPVSGDRMLAGQAQLQLEHRLYYDWGEAGVRHSATILGSPAGAADAAAFGGGNGVPDEAGAFGLLPGTSEQPLHRLHQASLVLWPSDYLTLQAGRFSLPWGVGVAFHPGDAIHPARTPEGDMPGFDGVAAVWTVSPDLVAAGALRVDTAYGITGQWYRELRWAGQISGYWRELEVAAGVVYQPGVLMRSSLGMSLPTGGLVLHVEAAGELIGQEQVGTTDDNELLDGSSAGFGFGLPDLVGQRPGWAGAAGGSWSGYAGSHAVTAVTEYLYLSAPPAGFGQHGLYGQIVWEFDRRLSAEQSLLADLEGRNMLLLSTVTLGRWDALELQIGSVAAVDSLLPVVSDNWQLEALRLSARVYF